MKKLVLVTGSGRSGTSSVAGTLYRFGFFIPQPMVEADEKNPRGFYEPRWVAAFHGKWLKSVPVRTIDSRPNAGQIAMDSLTDELEERLQTWLYKKVKARPDGDVMVIKETRAYWVLPLWRRVSEAAGAEMSTLTMLRHPTQVVRSRETAWLSKQDEETRVQRETTNVAAWMNSVFETERATRGHTRAFVPYLDFIADWRAAMTRACAQLEIDPGDLTAPHPVDDFITPSLNRASDSWDGLEVPRVLREMADRTWAAAYRLVDDPDDAEAEAELDRLREEYVELYTFAANVTADETQAQLHEVRVRTAERVERLREKVERLEARNAELQAAIDGSVVVRGRRFAGRVRRKLAGRDR